METLYDFIVVGSGLMGSSAAYCLSKTTGSKVLLLEQFDRLHRKGSSHGDSRIIRMTYPEDFNASLMPDAYKIWGDIEAEANTKILTKTGGLSIGRRDNSHVQSIMKNLDKFRIPYTVFHPENIGEKYPSIHLPKDYIAIFNADGGILNATKAVATIQNLAERNGCTFLDNTPVTKIQIEKGKNINDASEIVTIEAGNGLVFRGRKCIVTAGAWTKKVLAPLKDFNLPIVPNQTTVGYWKVDSPDLYSAKNFPVFIVYDDEFPKVYGLPAFEYPHMIKCTGDVLENCDPDNRTFQPDFQCLLALAHPALQKFLSGVAETPALVESCVYTNSGDNQFIIDTLPLHPNIVLGCGFSGHGFKLGPLVGKILAELATTGNHLYPHVHPHFGLERFQVQA